MRASAGGVRFAPSPTGRFHLGNLRTAWLSHYFARATKAPWVVRFEEIDAPRVVEGAAAAQLSDLAELGLRPDLVLYQTQQREFHAESLLRAVGEGRAYPCGCTRREVHAALSALASAPNDGTAIPDYTGHCSSLSPEEWPAVVERARENPAGLGWRFRRLEGAGRLDPLIARTAAKLGADGLPLIDSEFVPAYHWACALDDAREGHRAIVRASDLRSALAPQREIQSWFDPGRALPMALHTALVIQADGSRLEKRTRGVTLAELHSSGWSSVRLIEAFEKSLPADFPGGITAGSIWEEKPERLSVPALLGSATFA